MQPKQPVCRLRDPSLRLARRNSVPLPHLQESPPTSPVLWRCDQLLLPRKRENQAWRPVSCGQILRTIKPPTFEIGNGGWDCGTPLYGQTRRIGGCSSSSNFPLVALLCETIQIIVSRIHLKIMFSRVLGITPRCQTADLNPALWHELDEKSSGKSDSLDQKGSSLIVLPKKHVKSSNKKE